VLAFKYNRLQAGFQALAEGGLRKAKKMVTYVLQSSGPGALAITLGPHDVVQEIFYRSADPAQHGCGLRQWAGQEHGVVCTLDFE
jgi:hypothetical protein